MEQRRGHAPITVNASGTYTVTVTDGNGCQAEASQSVTVNPLPVVSITPSGTTTFCQGGSVDLVANPAGASYLWSNGAVTRSITVNASGTYTVTVTDGNGCQAEASQSVTVNPLPVVSITPSGTTTFCPGGSVDLVANPAGASYLWSNGAVTRSITVNASGTYTVTVTDGNGCQAEASQE